MRKLIKIFLPKTLTLRVYNFKTKLNFAFIKVFAGNSFLSSFYYCFFSTEFRREHKAVLLGRIEYKRSLIEIKESCALLRRNIHRLEKGLIMQPRREIFAAAYIGETVECYCRGLNSKLLCMEEKKWAKDVLTHYFSIVGSNSSIDAAKLKFHKTDAKATEKSYIPYLHNELPTISCEYPELLQLFKRRRSVRWYTQQQVPEDLIKQAVNAATFAPSACNRQPYQFCVINNAAKAADVAKCAMGTAGFADNLQCIVAIVGDLSAYPAERDRHVIYIDASLASMQLMLAFETLGLSTCPINWPDVEERERMISNKLGLSYQQRVVMLMAVGYAQPEGGIPFSQKKQDNLLIKEIK